MEWVWRFVRILSWVGLGVLRFTHSDVEAHRNPSKINLLFKINILNKLVDASDVFSRVSVFTKNSG